MCNLYLMYYTPSEHDDWKVCSGQDNKTITKILPEDSDIPISELITKEATIPYDNGLPNRPVPKKKKKQFGGLFGGIMINTVGLKARCPVYYMHNIT